MNESAEAESGADSAEPLDLTLLATFYEVARSGSVRRAAAALGRSQPAVSHRLRALESQLGVRLFERAGRGLRLSASGRSVLERTREFVALSAKLRRTLAAAREEVEGRLIIGTLPTLSSQLLARPLARFIDEHPRLSLRITFGLSDTLIDDLGTGRIDLALLIDHQPPRRFAVHELGAIRLAAVFAAGSEPSGRSTVSVRELRKERYLSWSGLADPSIDQVEHYVLRHGLADESAWCIPHIETLRELVAAGVGYTIVPAYTAWNDVHQGRLALRHAAGLRAPLRLFAATREIDAEWPALRSVLELCRSASAPLRAAHGASARSR